MKTIRVGTRGSKLALTQTHQIIDSLRAHYPDVAFEVVVIKTAGDMREGVPFRAVGVKGMFVKEIEEALLAEQVDFAVHSLKDLPGTLPSGLCVAAIPAREDPRDALLSHGCRLAELPEGARVGTSSLRRQAQLRAHRPDLRLEELRGNLDTRLRKLDEGRYDAIVLACAGLERLGWAHRIVERLPIAVSVPAPGQGALALEARVGDENIRTLLTALHDAGTADAVEAERSFQEALGAGCTVPLGAYAHIEDDCVHLIGMIATPDGSVVLHVEETGPRNAAGEVGRRAAQSAKKEFPWSPFP
jgi:hydroxymethylbilane synthase